MLPAVAVCEEFWEKLNIDWAIVLVRWVETSQTLMTWLCDSMSDDWERQTLIISLWPFYTSVFIISSYRPDPSHQILTSQNSPAGFHWLGAGRQKPLVGFNILNILSHFAAEQLYGHEDWGHWVIAHIERLPACWLVSSRVFISTWLASLPQNIPIYRLQELWSRDKTREELSSSWLVTTKSFPIKNEIYKKWQTESSKSWDPEELIRKVNKKKYNVKAGSERCMFLPWPKTVLS